VSITFDVTGALAVSPFPPAEELDACEKAIADTFNFIAGSMPQWEGTLREAQTMQCSARERRGFAPQLRSIGEISLTVTSWIGRIIVKPL
jgi:hypothetical protein